MRGFLCATRAHLRLVPPCACRYGRALRNKNVSGYSAADLSAILGHVGPPAEAHTSAAHSIVKSDYAMLPPAAKRTRAASVDAVSATAGAGVVSTSDDEEDVEAVSARKATKKEKKREKKEKKDKKESSKKASKSRRAAAESDDDDSE